MKHTYIYLVRHGQTDWNAKGKIQGSIETDLDAVGEMQAKAVGEHLAGIPLSAVYSSPQRRAMQTASFISSHHGYTPSIIHNLREGTHGRVDGMELKDFRSLFAQEIKRRHQLNAYERLHHKYVEDAETDAEVAERALLAIKEIRKKHKAEHVAIVSHGWLIRTLITLLGRYDDRLIVVKNGAIVQLVEKEETLEVLAFQGVEMKKG